MYRHALISVIPEVSTRDHYTRGDTVGPPLTLLQTSYSRSTKLGAFHSVKQRDVHLFIGSNKHHYTNLSERESHLVPCPKLFH